MSHIYKVTFHALLVLLSVWFPWKLHTVIAEAKPLTFGDLPQKQITLPIPSRPAKAPQKAIPSRANAMIPVLKQAGFTGTKLKTAFAVMVAESGGRPEAFNGNAKTGDKSYGIFQINMLGSLGPARRRAHGLKTNDELYDPLVNAKVAYAISNGGKNWKPWGAYLTGAYKPYLTEL